MKHPLRFSKVLSRGPGLRASLPLLIIALLASSACSNDSVISSKQPTPTTLTVAGNEPAITPEQPFLTTQGSVGNEIVPKAMIELPNIADTVEQARPAVVSIVAKTISLDSFGRHTQGFGTGT